MSELDKSIEVLKKGKIVYDDFDEEYLLYYNENSKGEYEVKEIKQAIDTVVSTIEQLRDKANKDISQYENIDIVNTPYHIQINNQIKKQYAKEIKEIIGG